MKSRFTKGKPNAGDDVKAIMDGLRLLMKFIRDSSQDVEQMVGITTAQLFVLQALSQEPFLSINDLAARTFTHQSSVSVVAAKLVAKGYARRAPSEQDRRRVVLNVTTKGKALLRRAPVPAQNTLVANIAEMPVNDRRSLRNGLVALACTLKHEKANPPMFFEN